MPPIPMGIGGYRLGIPTTPVGIGDYNDQVTGRVQGADGLASPMGKDYVLPMATTGGPQRRETQ